MRLIAYEPRRSDDRYPWAGVSPEDGEEGHGVEVDFEEVVLFVRGTGRLLVAPGGEGWGGKRV